MAKFTACEVAKLTKSLVQCQILRLTEESLRDGQTREAGVHLGDCGMCVEMV